MLRLIKLCETRWIERKHAFLRFKELYLAVLLLCQKIKNGREFGGAAKGAAEANFAWITKTDNIFRICFLAWISNALLPLSLKLQEKNVDLIACLSYIKGLEKEMESHADPSSATSAFKHVYKETEDIASANDLLLVTPRRFAKQFPNPREYYQERVWKGVMQNPLRGLPGRGHGWGRGPRKPGSAS